MHNGENLDPSIPEEMLRPYPELLQHWQATVLARDAVKRLGSGGVARYYSPVYLRAVIHQHLWLTEGPGDNPDPELDARCEAIAATYPGFAERRRRELNDPWWRALSAPRHDHIDRHYDPTHLERMLNQWRKSDDPYSAEGIKCRQVAAMVRAGATLVQRDARTGEEVARFTSTREHARKDASTYN